MDTMLIYVGSAIQIGIGAIAIHQAIKNYKKGRSDNKKIYWSLTALLIASVGLCIIIFSVIGIVDRLIP